MINYTGHPLITRALSTGYAHKEITPICPLCGSEAYTVFYDMDGTLFGCNECIKTSDAWEEPACYSEVE